MKITHPARETSNQLHLVLLSSGKDTCQGGQACIYEPLNPVLTGFSCCR